MFHVAGASNIKIEGLVLESGRGNAIFINSLKFGGEIRSKSNNILVENCIIRNFNQWGVIIQNAQNSTVNNCHIYSMGAGGVKLGNETRSFNLVNENLITDYLDWIWPKINSISSIRIGTSNAILHLIYYL